jgi:Holliday junction DNA helicase RuvA
MIVRISGKLVSVNEGNVVLDRDGIWQEINIPTFARGVLSTKVGQNITLYTIEYYEGTAVGGNLFPRLVGFLEPEDRTFFTEFVKVKGLGYRKALKALALPINEIAAAIEQSDIKVLSHLPEIGKRTSEQLVATLKGKLDRFVYPGQTATIGEQPVLDDLDQFEHEALEVLIQLGEKRNDAIEMIQKVRKADPSIKDPGKIVEGVYRRKAGIV